MISPGDDDDDYHHGDAVSYKFKILSHLLFAPYEMRSQSSFSFFLIVFMFMILFMFMSSSCHVLDVVDDVGDATSRICFNSTLY